MSCAFLSSSSAFSEGFTVLTLQPPLLLVGRRLSGGPVERPHSKGQSLQPHATVQIDDDAVQIEGDEPPPCEGPASAQTSRST